MKDNSEARVAQAQDKTAERRKAYRALFRGEQDWTPGQPLPAAYHMRWLRQQDLGEPPWLVNERIPYGIWNQAAPAGALKSAIGYQIAAHVSYRVPLPHLDWEFAEHGHCLIITPDETPWEMQQRDLKILPGGQLDTDDLDDPRADCDHIYGLHEPQGLTLNTRIAWLKATVETIETTTGRKVVWIAWDTQAGLLGDNEDGKNAYQHAKPLQELNAWAATHRKVIYLPNHIAKDGRAIGTVAIDAYSNLNTVIELDEDGYGVMKVKGKMRGGAHWTVAVKNIKGLAHLDDQSPHEALTKRSLLPRRVVEWLLGNGPATRAEILDGMGLDAAVLDQILRRQRARGIVAREHGYYSLVDMGTTAPPPPAPAEEAALLLLGLIRECEDPDELRRMADEIGEVASIIPEEHIQELRDAYSKRMRQISAVSAGQTPNAESNSPSLSVPCHALHGVSSVSPTSPPSPVEPDGPETQPEIDSGNPAIESMIKAVKDSPMYAVRRLPPEIKSQLGWDKVCLGLGQNRYHLMRPQNVDNLFESDCVVVFDRKAGYYQSCKTWMAPNVLHREGDLDYHDVVARSLAGMFAIITPQWESTFLNPLGPHAEAGREILVPRPTLDRLMEYVRDGSYCEEPPILYALAGKGTERGPLFHWAVDCIAQRTTLEGEQLATLKATQNQAFGALRIADPDKQPGPVDRPDWQYAVVGHHFAQMHRYVQRAHNLGEPVMGYGNTDEIAFRVPDGQDAQTWVPESMKAHLAKARFSEKYRTTIAEWIKDPMRRGHGTR